MVEGEDLGWGSITFSGHNFGPGLQPSQNLMIAHHAARPKKLRLGALGTSSAYATPWRVSEKFPVVDHRAEGTKQSFHRGTITRHSAETLAATDNGVVMLRRIPSQIVDDVEAGRDSLNVERAEAHPREARLGVGPNYG